MLIPPPWEHSHHELSRDFFPLRLRTQQWKWKVKKWWASKNWTTVWKQDCYSQPSDHMSATRLLIHLITALWHVLTLSTLSGRVLATHNKVSVSTSYTQATPPQRLCQLSCDLSVLAGCHTNDIFILVVSQRCLNMRLYQECIRMGG